MKTLARNMDNFKSIPAQLSLREAIALSGLLPSQSLVVRAENGETLGQLSQNDIRRGIVNGRSLDDSAQSFLADSPTPVSSTATSIDPQENWVVLIAGGLGSRLGALTESCPKPLLQVNGRPILEIILENLKKAGFRRFFLSVNYMAELIVDYFGDGSRWGIEIIYLHEKVRLGTAGGLSLLPTRPKAPLLVMNGDLLTTLDIPGLLQFHREANAVATLGMRELKVPIPYGIVDFSSSKLNKIHEKPTYQYFMNAGIYVLNPEALDVVPSGTYYDMTSLCDTLAAKGSTVSVFPIWEYWLDIGRTKDLERAKEEFDQVFRDRKGDGTAPSLDV